MELQGLDPEWDWIPTPSPGDLIRHPNKAWGGHDYRYCMRRVEDKITHIVTWVYDPDQEAKYLARREVAITKREIAITKREKMAELVLGKKRRREQKLEAEVESQKAQKCTCEYCR